MSLNLWVNAEHALGYLSIRDTLPHRVEGLGVLCELLPEKVERVLDLGTGDGDTLALVLAARPGATGVGLDFGEEMLRRARDRFAGRDDVEIAHHDMEQSLPVEPAVFDLVVSSFAIHHLAPARQRALYGEVFEALRAGGTFVNLEHVASRSEALHASFLRGIGVDPADDDPSNRCVGVEDHVSWLDEVGFENVDCFWKWRELAVVGGIKS